MKKKIALLAATALLTGTFAFAPASAAASVVPQSDVLQKYDFEDATESLFVPTSSLVLAEIYDDDGNKVQRLSKNNNPNSGSTKNDTMFNLPYIPEIMEISYDVKLADYGSLPPDGGKQIWFSTYLKVGTGNGDEENFYSRHRFPKFMAYQDNNVSRGWYLNVDGNGDPNITASGASMSTMFKAWNTVIIRINNKTKTSEVFAKRADDDSTLRKLGESRNIEIKTNVFGIETKQDTGDGRRADIYLDNIEVRDVTEITKNSFSIGSLSVTDGLTGVAKLTDETARAELLFEGTKIADLDASVNKVFKVTADAADVIKNYGTEKFELVCYNASNEVIDRVAVYKEVSKQVYNTKNTLDSYDLKITESETSTKKIELRPSIMSTERITNKILKLSFDIAKTEETSKMGFRLNVKGVNDEYKLSQEAANPGKTFVMYLPDQYIVGDKSVQTNAVMDTKDMKLNTKYHVDIVFNPNAVTIDYNITSDGEEKAHLQIPFIRAGTTVPLYGLEPMDYYCEADQGGQGALQITDMTFSALEEMLVPSAKSYILHSGESAAVVNGTVPTSAKSVLLNIAGYGNIDPAAVKVLKDGAEVSGASVSIAANTLKVAAAFEEGRYDVVVPAGAAYCGNTLSLPIKAGFNIENNFAILSPANGTVVDIQGTKIAVADDGNMTSAELYIDGVKRDMEKNEAGIWEYAFVPEHTGSVTVEAVAYYADGTTKKDTVEITIRNTMLSKNNNVSNVATTQGGFKTIKSTIEEATFSATGACNGHTLYLLNEEYSCDTWNGELKFGFDISFSDVTKFKLNFETGRPRGDGKAAWDSYPMNTPGDDYFLNLGNARNAYGEDVYKYESGKTYRIEFEYDMTNKVQSGYITDLSTGIKTMLCKDIKLVQTNQHWANVKHTEIPDNSAICIMRAHVYSTDDANGDTFTISNPYFGKVIDLPEIVAVSYEKDGTFVPAENGMIKKTMKIKYTLSSSLLNENDMSVDYIKLYKDGEETFVDEISYSAPEITVTLSEDTEEFAEYKLEISGEVTVNSTPIGLPIVNYVRVANESGIYLGKAEIDKSGTILKVSVPVDNSGSPASARLFIATYAGDKLTGVKMSAASSVTGFGKLYAELPYTGEDDVAKVFLWQSAESKTPLKTAEEISLK